MGDHMFANTMWAGHWLWMLVVAVVVVVLVQREMDIGGSGYRSQKSKLTSPHRLRLPAGLKNYWVAPANDPKMMARTHSEAKGSWSRLQGNRI